MGIATSISPFQRCPLICGASCALDVDIQSSHKLLLSPISRSAVAARSDSRVTGAPTPLTYDELRELLRDLFTFTFPFAQTETR